MCMCMYVYVCMCVCAGVWVGRWGVDMLTISSICLNCRTWGGMLLSTGRCSAPLATVTRVRVRVSNRSGLRLGLAIGSGLGLG